MDALKLTLDRFENGKAVLKTDDGETIVWPKNKLPENTRESAILYFTILNDKQAEKEKKEMAKEILNQLLVVDP